MSTGPIAFGWAKGDHAILGDYVEGGHANYHSAQQTEKVDSLLSGWKTWRYRRSINTVMWWDKPTLEEKAAVDAELGIEARHVAPDFDAMNKTGAPTASVIDAFHQHGYPDTFVKRWLARVGDSVETTADALLEDSAATVAKHTAPDAIAQRTRYYSNLKFGTPEEARERVFRDLERSDQAYPMFGVNGPEANRAIAAATPVYKIGHSYKIGRRTNPRKPQWDGIEIVRPSLAPLQEVGWLNPFDGYRVLGIAMKPVGELHGTEPAARNSVEDLAEKIKANQRFTAIIVDTDGTILDGHHRYKAVRDIFRWKQIPCLVVEIGRGD